MSFKLITEQINNLEYISETTESGKKAFYITGPFIQTEVVNRNGRLYQKPVMEQVISKYNQEKIMAGSAMGECGHPQGPTINLDRVCILTTEAKWDGNDVIGKARVTETPMGNIVKGLMESGARLGVSSRGMGELVKRDDGVMLVKENFFLATIADVVADPSAPTAFVKGIMEGVEYFYDESNGSWYQENANKYKKSMNTMSVKQIEENKIKIFESFIKSLTKSK